MTPRLGSQITLILVHPGHIKTQKTIEPIRKASWNRAEKQGRLLKLLSLLIFLLTLNAGNLWAATITASSCSFSHVQAALNSAANGDTVVVPPGNCTWTTSLDLDNVVTNGRNKYLTLRGAGIDQTIIRDGVSKDNYPNVPHLIRWTTVSGGLTRVTGFTFQGGTIVDDYNKGMLYFRGNSNQFRFDHNKVIPTATSGMFLWGNIRGVVDHNTFDVKNGFGLYVHHDSWNGTGGYGDSSWASPSSLGTSNAVFVEDNAFTNNQSDGYHQYATDGWNGGRVVYRYNTFTACTLANHGTDSGGRERSQRHFEVYNNTWIWNMQGGNNFASLIGYRGGSGVVFNNTATITNGTINTFIDFQYYRAGQSWWPFGKCPSAWDFSSTRCLDQTGNGQGAMISGDTPSPATWPNQAVEPAYIWNNKINGVVSNASSNVPNVVIANRDFFNQVKPGYTPYAYPHPLASGTTVNDPPPGAPVGVAVH